MKLTDGRMIDALRDGRMIRLMVHSDKNETIYACVWLQEARSPDVLGGVKHHYVGFKSSYRKYTPARVMDRFKDKDPQMFQIWELMSNDWAEWWEWQ